MSAPGGGDLNALRVALCDRLDARPMRTWPPALLAVLVAVLDLEPRDLVPQPDPATAHPHGRPRLLVVK